MKIIENNGNGVTSMKWRNNEVIMKMKYVMKRKKAQSVII
jgi:hypothetical protein